MARALAPWLAPIPSGLALLLATSIAAARPQTGADGAWSEVPPPVGRDAIVYDPPRQRMIVLGGAADDNTAGVWVAPMGGPSQWVFVPTTGAHPQLGNASAVYDSVRDRLVVFATDAPH